MINFDSSLMFSAYVFASDNRFPLPRTFACTNGGSISHSRTFIPGFASTFLTCHEATFSAAGFDITSK